MNRNRSNPPSLLCRSLRILRHLLAAIAGTAAFVCAGCMTAFWGPPFGGTRHGPVPVTPPWALECWLWEDDVNTADAVLELLDGYEKHDIPVRTILIDSPWSTRYNDFTVDEERYPEPEQFFRDLDDRGYRVVLWMTCMVNSENKDTAILDSSDWYEQARQAGYLAADGYQAPWWKGRGGFIDYTGPQAMEWWRGMQQPLFDWGIDGWKLDGTATFFSNRVLGVPLPFQRTSTGWMSTRRYMDHYYRDEYLHGLTQNPEFVTLSRALDTLWLHPEGFAPRDAAPVTWVGDQDHAWSLDEEGLEEALKYVLASARKGYCVVGSDVAGFGGAVIPPRLYIRWAQFSAFCGLFLNGGHGERALWKRSPEELEIIRKFSWLHTELIPYIYSHVVACNRGGKPLMRPSKGKYHYLFGEDLLVAPIFRDSLTRTVHLPRGKWRYLFDDAEVIEGPVTLTRDFPLDEYPVYIREGAIVPMNVCRDYTGFGSKASEGFLTVLIYPDGESRFTIYHGSPENAMTIAVTSADSLRIDVAGATVPHILRVKRSPEPEQITFDGQSLQEGRDWTYDSARSILCITAAKPRAGRYEVR